MRGSKKYSKPEKKVMGDDTFHKPPLYYYREYLTDRSSINPNIPLTTHYANERQLRLLHYQYLSKIQKLKEKQQFNMNDYSHEILKNENEKVMLQDRLKFLQRRISQRQTAIKFQIDHNYAWKTFYLQRMRVNK